jgi:hypothetical protein
MSQETLSPASDAFSQHGVRVYLFVGFGALLVAWLLLMERVAFGGLAMFVLFLGSISLLPFLIPPHWGWFSRWLRRPLPSVPIFVFFVIAVIETLFGEMPFGARNANFSLDDLLVIALLLTYGAAHYRLLSMGYQLIPIDPRPHPLRPLGDRSEIRPAERLVPNEFRDLGLTLLLSISAAIGTWVVISQEPILPQDLASDQLNMSGTWRRTMLTLWFLGALVVVGGQLFRLIRFYLLTPDEARMILQDAVWSESRSEQRRHARWLAWLNLCTENKQERQL